MERFIDWIGSGITGMILFWLFGKFSRTYLNLSLQGKGKSIEALRNEVKEITALAYNPSPLYLEVLQFVLGFAILGVILLVLVYSTGWGALEGLALRRIFGLPQDIMPQSSFNLIDRSQLVLAIGFGLAGTVIIMKFLLSAVDLIVKIHKVLKYQDYRTKAENQISKLEQDISQTKKARWESSGPN